jgi:hypothetical protein
MGYPFRKASIATRDPVDSGVHDGAVAPLLTRRLKENIKAQYTSVKPWRTMQFRFCPKEYPRQCRHSTKGSNVSEGLGPQKRNKYDLGAL